MNPLILAVDRAEAGAAAALLRRTAPALGGFKLGLEAFSALGPAGIARLAAEAPGLELFLDLKLHDIPATVAAAVRALAPLAPSLLTVHASGGQEMMKAAREAAPPGTRILAVTVLTSLGPADLEAIGWPAAELQVERLAELARKAGADGLVLSPREVGVARRAWPDALLVTPGIRPADSPADDQRRTATAREALNAGADRLVVGRPISRAADPLAAARALLAR